MSEGSTTGDVGGDHDLHAGHPVLIRFGTHLRTLRREAHLTQEQLGAAANLHWTYISQVERGKRNLTYKCLLRLSIGLGVPVARLLEGQALTSAPDPAPWGEGDRLH